MRTAAGLLVAALSLLGAADACAAISVAPLTPATSDTVTLTLSNQFFSDAHVSSATIAQNGNAFVIEQNVTVGCTAPNAPVITSRFPVGPLPAGLYTVEAHVNMTGLPSPPCIASSGFTQTTTFAVTPPVIPAIERSVLALLAVAMLFAGLVRLRA